LCTYLKIDNGYSVLWIWGFVLHYPRHWLQRWKSHLHDRI